MNLNKNIIGSGGGKGSSGGGAVEAPDDLISSQFVQVVDLLCEGEIEGLINGDQSIFLDGTPLQNPDLSYNFKQVNIDWRNGTQTQTIIPGNDSVRSETSVGIEITKSSSVVRQITNPELDSVNITISVPRLTYQNTSTGDLSGSSVDYTIELQSNGGGYTLQDTINISGKTTSTYKRSTNIQLTGSQPWDIRVTRITDDSSSINLSNKTYFDSYTSIINTRLNYPNSALVGIRIDSKQFNSIPSRGYEVKLLKVKIPSNYDPITRIYTGIWDGTFSVAWTDNPAWCYYDLITNDRYGLGKFINESLNDKWALYEIAQYCDGQVLTGFLDQTGAPLYEPRFTCNLYLQKREEAYKVIRDMVSIFRAMLFWSSNGVTVVQDKPDLPYSQFTNASVIDGMFNYEGSSSKVRRTTAIITWNDPEDSYKQKLEYVEDINGLTKFGINELQTVAMGCTSRGQAHRLGKWLLFSENNETEVVSFKIGLEGANLLPGSVIKTIDSHRAGVRSGGRLKSVSLNTVTIDSDITFDAGITYTISFVLPDGTIEDKIVTNQNGIYRVITLDSDLTVLPIVNSIWIISSVNLSHEEWRVISITEEDANVFTVSALEYNNSKYDFTENGLALEIKDSTLWENTSPPITSLTYEESLYEISYQNYGTKIHLTWVADRGAMRFKVRWHKDNNNYNVEEVSINELELKNVGYGVFDFQIISYNTIGVASPVYEINNQVILGITAQPADVTNFQINIIDGSGLLTWDAIPDLDVKEYEVREGTVWDTAIRVIDVTKLLETKLSKINVGINNYLIRSIDLSGNFSVNPSSTSITITSPLMLPLSAVFGKDNVVFSWSSTSGSFSVSEYEVREGGTNWETSNYLSTVEGNSYSESVNWTTRTIRVKAIDSYGNYSSNEEIITSSISLPAISNITGEHTSDSFTFKWESTGGSLASIGYDVRYGGSNWDTAIRLGVVEGTTYQLVVGWDSRLFRVRAKDSIGTLSNELTITSTVSAPVAPVMNQKFAANKLTIEFSSVIGTLAISEYEVREGGTSWNTSNLLIKTTGTNYSETIDKLYSGKTYRVKAIDASGKYSSETIEVVSVSAPSQPIISESFDAKSLTLSWTSTAGTFQIDNYEVRYGGTTWANSTSLGFFDISAFTTLVEFLTRKFFVRAIDIIGFESSEGERDINILPPQISTASVQIIDNNVLLKWSINNGTLPSDEIEARKGSVYASSEIIGKKTGTFTILFESLGGTFTYWLTPIDSAGNYGSPYSIIALVNQPPDYVLNKIWNSDFSGDKINAIIEGRTHLQSGYEPSEIDDWIDYSAGKATISASTDFYSGTQAALITYSGSPEPSSGGNTSAIALTIPEYISVDRNATKTIRVKIRAKKPTTNASNQFSIAYSTNGAGNSGWIDFTPTTSWQLFEFTYLVAAGTGTDYLGILGDTSLSGLGVLVDEMTISIDGTIGDFSNTGILLAPVILGDTFAEHFTNNSWNTADDQINASYPFYLQPTPNPASYIEIFDYGQILAATKVSILINKDIIAGNPIITPTISLSLDNVNYVDYVGVTNVIDNNFRYVKITLDIDQAADDKGLLKITSLEVILDAKLINDAGSASSVSTDSGGSTVNFNKTFLDIESIIVTPMDTVQVTPVVNFVDTPSPTSFKVLLYDASGNRYSGNFTWSAKGY